MWVSKVEHRRRRIRKNMGLPVEELRPTILQDTTNQLLITESFQQATNNLRELLYEDDVNDLNQINLEQKKSRIQSQVKSSEESDSSSDAEGESESESEENDAQDEPDKVLE